MFGMGWSVSALLEEISRKAQAKAMLQMQLAEARRKEAEARRIAAEASYAAKTIIAERKRIR